MAVTKGDNQLPSGGAEDARAAPAGDAAARPETMGAVPEAGVASAPQWSLSGLEPGDLVGAHQIALMRDCIPWRYPDAATDGSILREGLGFLIWHGFTEMAYLPSEEEPGEADEELGELLWRDPGWTPEDDDEGDDEDEDAFVPAERRTSAFDAMEPLRDIHNRIDRLHETKPFTIEPDADGHFDFGELRGFDELDWVVFAVLARRWEERLAAGEMPPSLASPVAEALLHHASEGLKGDAADIAALTQVWQHVWPAVREGAAALVADPSPRTFAAFRLALFTSDGAIYATQGGAAFDAERWGRLQHLFWADIIARADGGEDSRALLEAAGGEAALRRGVAAATLLCRLDDPAEIAHCLFTTLTLGMAIEAHLRQPDTLGDDDKPLAEADFVALANGDGAVLTMTQLALAGSDAPGEGAAAARLLEALWRVTARRPGEAVAAVADLFAVQLVAPRLLRATTATDRSSAAAVPRSRPKVDRSAWQLAKRNHIAAFLNYAGHVVSRDRQILLGGDDPLIMLQRGAATVRKAFTAMERAARRRPDDATDLAAQWQAHLHAVRFHDEQALSDAELTAIGGTLGPSKRGRARAEGLVPALAMLLPLVGDPGRLSPPPPGVRPPRFSPSVIARRSPATAPAVTWPWCGSATALWPCWRCCIRRQPATMRQLRAMTAASPALRHGWRALPWHRSISTTTPSMPAPRRPALSC